LCYTIEIFVSFITFESQEKIEENKLPAEVFSSIIITNIIDVYTEEKRKVE
jgi:hypothetical protein